MPERVVTVRPLLGDAFWRIEDSSSSDDPPMVRGHDAAIAYAEQLLAPTGGRVVVIDKQGGNTVTVVPGPLLARPGAGRTDTTAQPLDTWSAPTLAFVGLFGTAAAAALTAGIATAVRSTPSVDDAIDWGTAFWVTFPFAVSVTVAMWLLCTGTAFTRGWTPLTVRVVGTVAFTLFSTTIGIFFGLVPFLGGLISGAGLGWFLAERTPTEMRESS